MLSDFKRHLASNLTFLEGKKLLVAVSGGLDSMVLLHLCESQNLNISIAHCNFSLRDEESRGDEAFVINFGESNDIKVHSMQFDTTKFASDYKLSIQEAARNLRYQWFNELATAFGYDFILTAHHADDSLETFLINFMRGTGIDGLTGIPTINDKIVRPLLPFARSVIAEYATKENIKWREDSSNSSDKYLRNSIRHNIVPKLAELSPNLYSSFSDTINHLQQTQKMAQDAAIMVYSQVVIEKEDKLIIKLFDLRRLPDFKPYLYYWLKDFGFTAWDDIYALPDAQSGKMILSNGVTLLKDREVLILHSTVPPDKFIHEVTYGTNAELPVPLEITETDDISNGSDNCIFADADLLEFPLQLRKWEEGDYFHPFGMDGKKKVGKYFKDEKFSILEKADAWLLTSNENIVWIVGRRPDNRFRITPETTKILQIKTL